MPDGSLLVQMLIGALLGLSVYLPLAAGQLSLATPGFLTVGGYVAALLSTRVDALGGAEPLYPLPSLLLELVLAAVIALALALVVGLPVLRLRGIYLAIATIALNEILRVLLLNSSWTGGAVGIFAIPQPFGDPFGYLAALVLLLLLAAAACQALAGHPLGRAMAAVRDDELAASCSGVDSFRVKLLAFGASAVLAALTGVLAAHFFNTWNARQGSFDASITTLAFVVFGGSRLWLGPVLGGLVLTALPELLRPVGDLRLVVFGAVILLGPLLFPQGVVTPALLQRLPLPAGWKRRLLP